MSQTFTRWNTHGKTVIAIACERKLASTYNKLDNDLSMLQDSMKADMTHEEGSCKLRAIMDKVRNLIDATMIYHCIQAQPPIVQSEVDAETASVAAASTAPSDVDVIVVPDRVRFADEHDRLKKMYSFV